MYCSNCGKEVDENTKFCSYCGKPFSQNSVTKNTNSVEGATTKTANYKKWVLSISAIAIVLAVVVIIINFVSNSGYKKAIDNCMDVYFEGDFSNAKEIAPDEVYDITKWDFLHDLNTLTDEEYYTKRLQICEEEYGPNFSVEYNVVDEEKMDDDELDDFKQILSRRYDIPEISVKEGYNLLVEFTYKGSRDTDTIREELFALKINDTWYICDEDGWFPLNFFAGISNTGYWE